MAIIPNQHGPVKESSPAPGPDAGGGESVQEAALACGARGWLVVQVHTRSKKPVKTAWQKNATKDPDAIRRLFPKGSIQNLGALLGRKSGIIDVECDSEEAERELALLLGEDFPVVPQFRGKRGPHRLFQFTDGLPRPDSATFKYKGIEFRTGQGDKGAQSLLPPSIHPDGVPYCWIVHPDEADPLPFPPRALAVIREALGEGAARNGQAGGVRPGKSHEDWERIFGGVDKGGRNDAAISYAGGIMSDLRDPDDDKAIERAWVGFSSWNERNNPALPEDELRKVYLSALKMEKAKRGREHDDKVAKVTGGGESGPADGKDPPEWHLVIIATTPEPTYLLRGPEWSGLPKLEGQRGYIALKLEELPVWAKVCRAALAQAEKWPQWSGRKWKKKLDELLKAAEHKDTLPENKRPWIVLCRLWGHLRTAKLMTRNERGRLEYGQGYPERRGNGSVIVKMPWLLREEENRKVPVTMTEYLGAFATLGMEGKVLGPHTRKKDLRDRWWVISKEGLDKLRRMTLLEA
jgi:hypothetical protein